MLKSEISKLRTVLWTAIIAGLLIGGMGMTNPADAAFKVGAKKCLECHTAEAKVWQGTKHFKSYKAVHKDKRSKKIVMTATGVDYDTAAEVLDAADGHVKTALVMVLADVDAEAARARIEEADGFVRHAIAGTRPGAASG